MKINGFETLHCDAGWRVFSFLKLTTDDGLVGWSEYNQSYGSGGLTAVIEFLAKRIMGQNPLAHELLSQELDSDSCAPPPGRSISSFDDWFEFISSMAIHDIPAAQTCVLPHVRYLITK